MTVGVLALAAAAIAQATFTAQSTSVPPNSPKLIDIPVDPEGRHTVVSLHLDSERYWNLVSLRSSKSGDLYTNIRIDCDTRQYQLLHEAETLEALHDQRRLSRAWRQPDDRSIVFYKARYVCSKPQG